jgi:hypothetical protein
VRISSSETVEKAYDTASARNGNPRARPKSAPPTGGAVSRTADTLASETLEASASCGRGTTALNAPLMPERKTTAAEVSVNATSRISQ